MTEIFLQVVYYLGALFFFFLNSLRTRLLSERAMGNLPSLPGPDSTFSFLQSRASWDGLNGDQVLRWDQCCKDQLPPFNIAHTIKRPWRTVSRKQRSTWSVSAVEKHMKLLIIYSQWENCLPSPSVLHQLPPDPKLKNNWSLTHCSLYFSKTDHYYTTWTLERFKSSNIPFTVPQNWDLTISKKS